jgi:hypothetical protein
MGHAFLAMGKFRIIDAIGQNIFSAFVFYGGLTWLCYGNRIKYRPHKAILYTALLSVIGYGIIRNLL